MRSRIKKVFVVSACDGIGAAFCAVRILQLPFTGVACEKSPHLRRFVRDKWPQVATHTDLHQLDSKFISRHFVSSGADFILFIAGPDCQPFSSLSSNPKGFADPRADLTDACVLVRDICEAIAR